MSEQAFYLKPTWRQRVAGRLFPSRHVEIEWPEWAGSGDVVHNNTTVSLSFGGRLMVLLTGRIAVQARIVCEHGVGRTVTFAESWPDPPSWWWKS